MKLQFQLLTLVFVAIFMASCESDLITSEEIAPEQELVRKSSLSIDGTYELKIPQDNDALFSFTIDGDEIQLNSTSYDPIRNIRFHWGQNFFGFWKNPFPYADGKTAYKIGLNDFTYEFEFLGDDEVKVTRTWIQFPYLSNDPPKVIDTTPGIYELK